MPVTTTRLRGVHPRLAFPPPPRRPSLAVWTHVDGLDERLAWALFLVLRRARDAAEFPPSAAGRWKHTRDVRAAAARTPEIGDPLLLLGTGTTLRARSRADVARACHRLAKWAARGGYAEFAIQFAEAAAALQPTNAGRVFEAARTHRMFGNAGDAAVYYGRAICLGRSTSDVRRRGTTGGGTARGWHVYVRAHLGMGKLCEAAGDRTRAAAHYTTAAQAAWKNTGEKWLAGRTQHQMVSLMAETGEFEAAYQHALKAHAWMPKHNERVPALVHDYALLLVRMDAHADAMPLLEAVVEKDIPPVDRVIGWSTLARAAGAMKNVARYREAERMVHMLEPRFGLHAAAAHVNLGIGAQALGCFADAAQHALRAIELAKAQGFRGILKDAENLLAAARECEPTRPTVTDLPSRLRKLARDLTKRLAVWRGPNRARTHSSESARIGRV